MVDLDYDESIRETVRTVSSKFDTSYWREICKKQVFPDEYWNALSKSGLFGILIDKEMGGLGRGFVDLILGIEETAERYSGIGSYLFLSGSLVSQIFAKNGTEVQKKDLLPKFAKGELKVSVALAEEKSGTFASEIETSAVKVSPEKDGGGSFVINGSKSSVNNVDRADYLILFARTTPVEKLPKRSLGLSMFLVEANDPAIKRKKLDKIGWDFLNNFSLQIRDLRLSKENIIGEIDKAWYNVVDSFNRDRVATSASLVGTGKLALSQASSWAIERKLLGKAIGSNQGLQFPMADAMAQLLAAEAMTLKAASLAEQGKKFADEANYAFLRSVNAATAATDRALQAYGGHGYYKDYDVERYWRDVRAHKVHPVPEELILAAISEGPLGLPKSR